MPYKRNSLTKHAINHILKARRENTTISIIFNIIKTILFYIEGGRDLYLTRRSAFWLSGSEFKHSFISNHSGALFGGN
ncbi:unnamed protein product [Blepharisma stoltei]|uniref:Uncharacterized protein n=1 Tax=Blepharisma stoltei TaxID=1481888 RepID=A0AAU9JRC5_9CILI|nr:unnamed protein product [Blepharisma stoltei]